MSRLEFTPIGTLESVFKEKFGVPRQARLAPSARARLRLRGRKLREAVRGLEGFSHVWLVFAFHQASHWTPLVRPPRLGGARKVGVLASRSPHRPNPIGISAVELIGVTTDGDDAILELGGIDLVDGTPVLDVKPYLPYADAIPRARAGWAGGAPAPSRLRIVFEREASARLRREPGGRGAELRRLIREILRQDPRPAAQAREDGRKKAFAARVAQVDVHWEIRGDECRVTRIEDILGA